MTESVFCNYDNIRYNKNITIISLQLNYQVTIKCQMNKVMHKEMTIALLARNEIASIGTDMLRRREGYEVIG
ncbi:hypothetical protein DCS65_19175 [Bacillus subtilis]|nr:hypothetical protein DCS65_19175 [Bacillus subtilis]